MTEKDGGCIRGDGWRCDPKSKFTACSGCPKNTTEATHAPHLSGSTVAPWLDGKTVEACAQLLDLEAERLEEIWKEFMRSSKGGNATDYSAMYRSAAAIVRKAV